VKRHQKSSLPQGRVTASADATKTTEDHQKLHHIVDHVFDTWDQALGRWTYFRVLGKSAELAQALTHSYAAHVHNAFQDALLMDSLREIGAVILDKDPRSASLYRSLCLTKSIGVLDAIRKDYEVVPPVRHQDEGMSPELRAEVDAHMHQEGLERNRREFAALHANVIRIEDELFNTPVAKKVRNARNQAVAHYDVQLAGCNWKTMKVGDAGLTYGDMDAYIERCTAAVKTVTLFVQRRAMDFHASRTIYEKRAAEYIDALVHGRRSQTQKANHESNASS
jgi:hypothetical protein